MHKKQAFLLQFLISRKLPIYVEIIFSSSKRYCALVYDYNKQEAPGQLCLPCSKWRKRDKIINIFKRVKNPKLLQYSGKWHNMLKISTEKARKLQTFRHSLRQCGGPYLTKCHLKTSTEVSSF